MKKEQVERIAKDLEYLCEFIPKYNPCVDPEWDVEKDGIDIIYAAIDLLNELKDTLKDE